MALTYTWKLKSLKKTDADALSGVIVGTQWECTGTDEDGFSGTFHGATPFKLDEVDPENFTPYEELTQDQILGWIEAIVTGPYKDHVDSQIQKQIDAAKFPVQEISSGSFPWDDANAVDTSTPVAPTTDTPAA